MTDFGFSGQTIMVTGGSRGIGRRIAEDMISAGARVIVTATSGKRPAWLGKDHVYLPLDFSNPSWESRAKEAFANISRLDALINNAGINKIDDIRNVAAADLRGLIEVNLVAPAMLSGLAARAMGSSGGRIVNISSIFGVGSRAERSSYSATKAGLIGQTRGVALDLARNGILVNAVCPGFVKTELTERILGETGVRDAERRLPLGRLAEPKDISMPTLFLASRLNTYITGQTLIVDGGYLAE